MIQRLRFKVSSERPGPGCSKVTATLVDEALKFQMLISQICQYFCRKNVQRSFCSFFQFFNQLENYVCKIQMMPPCCAYPFPMLPSSPIPLLFFFKTADAHLQYVCNSYAKFQVNCEKLWKKLSIQTCHSVLIKT